MRMSMNLRMVQSCCICEQSVEEHAPDCELGILEKLLRNQISYECPLCHKSVSLNCLDFYECRDCHAQFSRTPLYGEPIHCGVKVFLLTESEALSVFVLAEKGKGEFKSDKAIARAEEALRQKRHQLGLEINDENSG